MSNDALRNFLLAFADDEHFMGQQHTEWIGVAPFLEEDLALASIGQDELGHAAMLYELVLELDGVEATDEAIDRLAYRRADDEYQSSAFAEWPTTDWSQALVRHWVYDMVEELRWSLVAESSHQPLADAAVRAGREETFHRRHADALLDTLLADEFARQRVTAALEVVLPLVGGLCSGVVGENELVDANIVSAPFASLLPDVSAAIEERFSIELSVDDLAGAASMTGRTQRSDHFAPLMARMREVLDLDPAAQW